MKLNARALSTSGTRLKSPHSHTLQLPKTNFSPKIPAGDTRKALLDQTGQKLYNWQLIRPDVAGEFVLHDGPPYANGDLHMGHALNKVLKDIINRHQLLHENKRVIYRPGWDCHGLPIEMKALESRGKKKGDLEVIEIRARCRELALSMIHKQREQFKQFGIMTDFEEPYMTLTQEYETGQLKVFAKLMENGLLTRQMKPVWWGCETNTALAEAELEYNPEHVSVAVYLQFPIVSKAVYEKLGSEFPQLKIKDGNLQLLIWTSTPWTLPANKAICVHREIDYTIIFDKATNVHLVVGAKLAEELCKTNENFSRYNDPIVFKGDLLLNSRYMNPANRTNEKFPILHGDHVSDAAGTGLVHTAPAHGGDDYHIGIANGLVIEPCVNGRGEFILENIPQGFQSLKNQFAIKKEGLWKCIEIMNESNMVFGIDKKYKHSYPYDWRSKKPVIQRATNQWFINVGKIKSHALEALEQVKFQPEAGKNRLKLFITNRNEWCISRQRSWGVPLPIVYHNETQEPITDLDVINHIIKRISELGTDCWFEHESDISRWLPDSLKPEASKFAKGKDTMDVWFDSGSSWTTLGKDFETLAASTKPLANVYLEGSDQHRGWFQSSILNKIIASGTNGKDFLPVAPYKEVVTHGFILDKKNDKMSKSKGNVISPEQVIEGGGKPAIPALGVDGLRLWIASSNFTQDVNITTEVLARVSENVKKLRVTLKYILGNLNDFESSDRLEYDALSPLDKYVLSRLYILQSKCVENYQNNNFARVIQELNTHISVDLSAQYFDISKDCLYTDAQNSKKRRGIQTVLEILFRTYVGIFAPIQPVLAQEAWSSAPSHCKTSAESPFMAGKWQDFYQLPQLYLNSKVEEEMLCIWTLRNKLYKLLEELRLKQVFKNKLENNVNIVVNEESPIATLLHAHSEYLEDYFLVSTVTINAASSNSSSLDHTNQSKLCIYGEEVTLQVSPADGHKCPRCWKHIALQQDSLCQKCETIVEHLL